MNGGPSGFNNAPVTRAFVIASAMFTLSFGIRRASKNLGLSYLDSNGGYGGGPGQFKPQLRAERLK